MKASSVCVWCDCVYCTHILRELARRSRTIKKKYYAVVMSSYSLRLLLLLLLFSPSSFLPPLPLPMSTRKWTMNGDFWFTRCQFNFFFINSYVCFLSFSGVILAWRVRFIFLRKLQAHTQVKVVVVVVYSSNSDDLKIIGSSPVHSTPHDDV